MEILIRDTEFQVIFGSSHCTSTWNASINILIHTLIPAIFETRVYVDEEKKYITK